jgi:hypothetical protein
MHCGGALEEEAGGTETVVGGDNAGAAIVEAGTADIGGLGGTAVNAT